MNKRKLRRVAIVALVLVLLCNTLGVQAETGAPAVTVSSYEELVNAIDQASNLDTILIEAVIWIPEGASLGDSSKTVILKSSGGYMEIVENTQSEEITSFTGLIFDGAGKELLAPYLRITGAVSITGCTFKNCGVNGAINMSYASCTIKNSSFKDNKNDYGAHILIGYKSTADISNSSFTDGIATVRGGGIYLDDPTSTATLTECTITGNVGAYGGGIANWGSLTLENTLLYANTASVGGADLFSTGSYSMESIEDSKEFYHEAGIEPLSWESDYIDPDYGATCIKLSYEEYIEPTEPVDPDPSEPSTPDPTDPVTPPSGGDEGKTDPEPTDPTPTEPTDPEKPDPEPTDPKPTEPDKPDTTEPSTEDPKPSTLTAEYMALSRESKSALKNNDVKRAQELSQRMLSIQLGNLISKEERQEEVDKTLVMPISEIFKEFNKYKAIMAECAEKIDNFDISSVQAKVDEVTEKYEKKAEGKSGIHLAQIKASYEKEVNDLEYKLIKIPMNDLKIKRYRASEFLLIYEARIKYYMTANKDLIEEEIQNAKREEIRGSLGDLVAYMEEA